MMPLFMAKAGETAHVRRISGGDGTRRRLAELGFTVDGPVTVVGKAGEDLIIEVKGARLALGAGMASKIFVSEEA